MDGQSTTEQVALLLAGKDRESRQQIASTLGPRLEEGLSGLDSRVAEELARQLAADAIERVRVALSKSLRHNRFLPRDIAYRLAHDIESVSSPFLEMTEVFSDEELCHIAREGLPASQGSPGPAGACERRPVRCIGRCW